MRVPAALFLGIGTMSACTHTNGAEALGPSQLVMEIAMAGQSCMLAASDAGADQSAFENSSEWVTQSAGSFRHVTLPIGVEFSGEQGGPATSCEVRSEPLSSADFAALKTQFEEVLQARAEKPVYGDYLAYFAADAKPPKVLVLRSERSKGAIRVKIEASEYGVVRQTR